MFELPSTSAKPDQFTDASDMVLPPAASAAAVLRTSGRCEDMRLRNASRALATADAFCCLASGASGRTWPDATTPAAAIPSSTATAPTSRVFPLDGLDDPKMCAFEDVSVARTSEILILLNGII